MIRVNINENSNEQIEECDEHILYFIIDGLGYRIWKIRHDSADGRIKFKNFEKEFNSYNKKIILAVEQTKRFGFTPTHHEDAPTDEYWSWYRQWDKWKKGMSEKEWMEFNGKLSRKEDVTKLLPIIDRTYPKIKV